MTSGSEANPSHARVRQRSVPIPEWARLHLWEMQPLRDLLVIATIVLLLWLGYILSIVTVPLLLALMLAYLFEPLVQRMTRSKIFSRAGAATIIIVAIVTLIVLPVTIGVSYGVVQAAGFARTSLVNTRDVVSFVSRFDANRPADASVMDEPLDGGEFKAALARQPQEVQDVFARLPARPWQVIARSLSKRIDRSSDEFMFVRDKVIANSDRIVETTLGTGAGAAAAILSTVSSVGVLLFSLFLTCFFFFFLSTGYERVTAFLSNLIKPKNRERTLELVGKMDRVIAGFVRGRLTICVVQCFVFSIGYFLIGVPAAVVLGIAVGVMAIVPYVALLGIPASIALIWLDPPGGFRGELWWILLAPVGVYVIGQALDDYVLTPLIQGKATGMDMPLVLFSTIAGGALAGIYGLLLAIPVAACLKIVITEVVWPKVRAWLDGRAADPLPIPTGRTNE